VGEKRTGPRRIQSRSPLTASGGVTEKEVRCVTLLPWEKSECHHASGEEKTQNFQNENNEVTVVCYKGEINQRGVAARDVGQLNSGLENQGVKKKCCA